MFAMRFYPYSFAQAREIGAIAAEAETPQDGAGRSQTNAAWSPISPLGRVVSLVSLSLSPDIPFPCRP